MSKYIQFSLLIALCLVGSTALLAQPHGGGRRGGPPPDQQSFVPGERPPGRGGRGGMDGGRPPSPPPPGQESFRFLSMDMRAGGKVVKSAPFSATAETEFVQTLGDGSTITRKNTALLYRDSEGRTRRDQTLSHVGPFATADDAPQMIFINDPVAGVNYMLDPRNQTVRKMPSRGGPPPPRPEQSEPRSPRNKPPNEMTTEQSKPEAKTESLGKQMIESVEAEGTRSTITIPVGKIGNSQPLEIMSERWYSSALQEVILSKHSDPRYGLNIYRLKNINRSEPSASLFQVPAEYTQQEGRGPKPMRRDDDE